MSVTKAQVDKFLTGVSKGLFPEGWIGDMIFPTIGNRKQNSGTLAGYGFAHLRLVNTIMVGQGKASRVTTRQEETTSYLIEDHGLEGLITKSDYDNVEDPYDAEKDEVEGITFLMKVAREKSIADALTSTSILTQNTTLSGTDQYNDYTNSDPIGDFKTARAAVYDGSGVPPDTAIMSWDVYQDLKFHTGLMDYGFKQNRKGQFTIPELAAIMEVDRLLIGTTKYNSAALGQTDALGNIWNKDVVFAALPKSARKKQVSLGYTVRKSGESPNQVFSYTPGNPPGAKAVIVTDNYDDLISNALAAYLIKDAVA